MVVLYRSRSVPEWRVFIRHVSWNSLICRKEAIHRTEIERPFLAAKGCNTNSVQFLPPYYVIISQVQVCSFSLTIPHVHEISCTKKYNL